MAGLRGTKKQYDESVPVRRVPSDCKKCDQPYSARRTWQALADFTSIPRRTLQSRRQELSESGVIFYVKRPGFRKKQIVCWFPAVVMAWFVKKGALGEVF